MEFVVFTHTDLEQLEYEVDQWLRDCNLHSFQYDRYVSQDGTIMYSCAIMSEHKIKKGNSNES